MTLYSSPRRSARAWAALVGLSLVAAAGAGTVLGGTPVSPPYTSTMSGTLNPRGDTRNFTFSYPGDNSTIWIQMSQTPADPIALNYGGFTVYAPGGAPVGTGQVGNPTANYFSSTGKTLPFSSPTVGNFTLQVYNYSPSNTLSYTVSIMGAALFEAPTVVPAAAPTTPATDGSSADRAQPITSAAAQQGTLDPQHQFAYYQFPYAGNQAPIWITTSFNPADPITMNYVGFVLYAPDGVADASGNLGTPPGYLQGLNSSYKTSAYASTKAGTFIIQVYNYSPTTTVSYVLTLIGLPGQPTPVASTSPPQVPSAPPATATPSFAAFWVKTLADNVQLYSDAVTPPAVSFGGVPQFSCLRVVESAAGTRLHVWNPATRNFAYVNAADVGGLAPSDRSCG